MFGVVHIQRVTSRMLTLLSHLEPRTPPNKISSLVSGKNVAVCPLRPVGTSPDFIRDKQKDSLTADDVRQ
mgnify:CR=1 FL=1